MNVNVTELKTVSWNYVHYFDKIMLNKRTYFYNLFPPKYCMYFQWLCMGVCVCKYIENKSRRCTVNSNQWEDRD